MSIRILEGHVLDKLRELPDESVQSIVTSPPYYAKYGIIVTMNTTQCAWCGTEIVRHGARPGRFCSVDCKSQWQRTQKPVSREWLYERYVVEGRSTYQIAREVGRDPKSVHNWLVDLGIPTRTRGWVAQPSDRPHQRPDWLREQYVERQRSASSIAAECGVTTENILFFLRRFNIARRTISETREVKHWGAAGAANPMFGKRGAEVPSWKGGVTPERQAFYSSPEWTAVAKAVWARDHATCQRCDQRITKRKAFAIHHIASFAVRELRAEITNLVLLCTACHRWVHSKKNTDGAFIATEEGGAK